MRELTVCLGMLWTIAITDNLLVLSLVLMLGFGMLPQLRRLDGRWDWFN